ncbi:MAG TPA: metalloregulator ArsR/SmtB family transcription factor [Anaerolineales bacterium]|nr:metalloregulator ArsR/SmtB family transcription factor [Anaerolineales bacterium]
MEGTLAALAEPNRVRIIELLRSGPRPVNEIVAELALPQPLVSKHLRFLREAGLVRVRPQGQQRLYELEPGPFQELDRWVSSFRRLWEDRLDRLDAYLQDIQRKKRTRK